MQGVGELEIPVVEGGFVELDQAADEEGVVVGEGGGVAGAVPVDAPHPAGVRVVQVVSDEGDGAGGRVDARLRLLVAGDVLEGGAGSCQGADGQAVPAYHYFVVEARSWPFLLSVFQQLSSTLFEDVDDFVFLEAVLLRQGFRACGYG